MVRTTESAQKERKPRSFWFDPRFAIGLVLVITSVLGVLALVTAADDTVRVYAARSALSVGDRIEAQDLTEQGVRLGSLTRQYLVAGDVPAEGLVVTKGIAEGELVPTSAVGDSAGTRLTSIVVTTSLQLPRSVDAGAVVDLWAARETSAGLYGPPSVLVPSATVVRLLESDGLMAGAGVISVEILVPRPRIARVLEALANRDAVSLVPVNMPARG
ncbi:MAG: rane protein [Homoserinimonas sp.]|jgi:hypothetical protein|nr:rane protein [Mycetocola sp.]MCU1546205.1 rane protein [Homoserinimonas sp.]